MALNINPFVGVGYDSLWLGRRLEWFAHRHEVFESHNGYLEVYLELGIVGLTLLVGLLLGVFQRARVTLTSNLDHARLQIALLFIFLVYNVTEAASKVTTLMFFVLLLVVTEFPSPRQPPKPLAARPPQPRRSVKLGPRESLPLKKQPVGSR